MSNRNESMQALFELIPAGVVLVCDELRISMTNRVFRGMSTFNDAELANAKICDVLPVEGLEARALEVLATGKSRLAVPFQLPTTDGKTRPIEVTFGTVEGLFSAVTDGQPAGRLLLFIKDLTAERDLRSRAQATERGFRDVIENAPDGVVVHRDARFVYINPSMLKTLGVKSAAPLLGRCVFDFVHPDDRDVLKERVRWMKVTGDRAPLRETKLLREDGSLVLAELTGMPLIFDGELAIVTLSRDVTEERELTNRMMQMDRMIAAGTLAAAVGHEINNPLTYVSSNLDFTSSNLDRLEAFVDSMRHELSKRLGEEQTREVFDAIEVDGATEEMREALKDARLGSDRIRDIVRELRAISTTEHDDCRPLTIQSVIESATEMVLNQIRHRARLVMNFEEAAPIYASESKIGQVFLNLMINAAQAIEEGAAHENEIRVHAYQDADWVVVEIQDTGMGISEEHLPRIFDPFFTTKPVGQGTGLGLLICQRIVESYGGRIEVTSKVAHGTLIRVHLPTVTQEQVADGSTRPPALLLKPTRRGRILVVDDDERVLRTLVRTLWADHDVISAIHGRQALDFLDAGERFDLILCDLMMPQMSGMTFYDEVTSKHPALREKIIFLTAGAFTPRAAAFLEQVSNPWMEKPFDADKLKALVNQGLDG